MFDVHLASRTGEKHKLLILFLYVTRADHQKKAVSRKFSEYFFSLLSIILCFAYSSHLHLGCRRPKDAQSMQVAIADGDAGLPVRP